MTGWVDDSNAALLTDLYELTMLQSYFDEGMNGPAVFDLFMRRLPPSRNYLVACGLEHVLHYLEKLSFSDEAIAFLRSLKRFSEPFLESLKSFRFTGDVYAMAEGSVLFANEPFIEIVAPLREAQFVETFLMNQTQMSTLAASKSARVVRAAQGRSVVDFGARRMQGADAAIKQPRAYYIAGVDSTSSVLAGQMWDIPVAGTMAHSYILAFQDETVAFRRFLRAYPNAILLIDTFDVDKAVEHLIGLAREMGPEFRVSGVRLDSGDLEKHARNVRRQLDAAGLTQVKIYASSSLDEYMIRKIVTGNIPIDGFGVGRNLATSADVPVLDTAYKLVEYAGQAKMKLSESKATLPGRKQVYRERSGREMTRDIIGLADERNVPGEPLLHKVMENGRRTAPPEPLSQCRARCKADLDAIPARLHNLSKADPDYPVDLSPQLSQLVSSILSPL
ncbi:MAG TPA: nicotinate phosphoribosyltransferase [Terriglobia bacterium]|jgi:nicotinate phosphoribosyltransferase